MGWGPLFFGYFVAFVPGQNALLTELLLLIGGAFMLWGLTRLSRYCHTFRYAAVGVLLMLALTLTGVVLAVAVPAPSLSTEVGGVADWLRLLDGMQRFAWLGWLQLLSVALFHVALAFSVKELAMRVGLEKNAVRALRNLVMFGVYMVATVLQRSGVAIAHLGEVATVVCLIVGICNSVMLYSCYMRIAPAEGEDAERETTPKPSRFAAVNRLRAKMKEREDKAREADREYNEQRLREEREKQLSRMSKKQRLREEARDRNKKT